MTNARERSSSSYDVVDLELNCLRCGTRLYASVPKAREAVATVRNGGIAILICVCGQAQYIRRKPSTASIFGYR